MVDISFPYTITRNPMLTRVFLLLFGIGFLIKSVSLVCIFTPLFILVMAWELKNIEEPVFFSQYQGAVKKKQIGLKYAYFSPLI